MRKVWNWLVSLYQEITSHSGTRSDRLPLNPKGYYPYMQRLEPVDRVVHVIPTTFTNEELTGYYQEGYTILEVAQMTHNTYYKVRNTLHKEGVVRKKGPKGWK